MPAPRRRRRICIFRFNLPVIIRRRGIFERDIYDRGAPGRKERASVNAGRNKIPELGFDDHGARFQRIHAACGQRQHAHAPPRTTNRRVRA